MINFHKFENNQSYEITNIPNFGGKYQFQKLLQIELIFAIAVCILIQVNQKRTEQLNQKNYFMTEALTRSEINKNISYYKLQFCIEKAYKIYKENRQMEKQNAEPQPTPNLSAIDEPLFPILMEQLSLTEKTASIADTQQQQRKSKNPTPTPPEKTKKIQKPLTLKRSYKKRSPAQRKQNYKKKVVKLQSRISELESQIDRLKRKMEGCPQCRFYSHKKQENSIFQAYRPNYEEQMKKIAGSLNESRGSMGSVQFQNIDFQAPMMMAKQIDEKAWVYLGALMIAMGSKNIEVDGTINVFRVLKQSVDTLRRQVQKSQNNISMDFYMTQEEMKENSDQFMQDIGFDPFTEKISGETGLSLEGIKIESVQQFELIYDNKLKYNIKYEALLGAMEYLRENSWLTF